MAYIIKVTIENTHPPVWRRILIPDKISFGDLHGILQTVFGWEEEHMHDFTFPSGSVEIVQAEEKPYGEGALEDSVAVDDFLPHSRWIRYTYDFGDDWSHKIVLEKTDPDYKERYAKVLKAKGDNFNEDSGGVYCAGDDDRNPFSMEKVNAALEAHKISEKKSDRHGEDLSRLLQLGEALKDNSRSGKRELEQMLGTLCEDLLKEQMMQIFFEDRLDNFFCTEADGSRSVRAQAADALTGYVRNRVRDSKKNAERFCVNIHEPAVTVREMLVELSGRELSDYCSFLSLECEECTKEQCIDAVLRTYREEPEIFLYAFTEQEFAALQKLLEIPRGRSYEADMLLLLKGITLGIMDVHPNKELDGNVVKLSFAADAGTLLRGIPEEEIRKRYGEISAFDDKIGSLLLTYSVLDAGALKAQYERVFRQEMDERTFRRLVYWHLRFQADIQIYHEEDGMDYLALPQVDIGLVLGQRENYGVSVPYRRFRKKELLSDSHSYQDVYPAWKEFEQYLCDDFELDDEELAFWSVKEYGLVQNGVSVVEVLEDLEDGFELSSIVDRTTYWEIITGICLNTPIPALMGYSRLEYSAMTDRQPWELGLYDFPDSDRQPYQKEDGLFGMEPQQQYGLYCIASKEHNSASDVRAVQEMIQKAPCELPDLTYMLAITHLKNNEIDKAERVLRRLYRGTKDESIADALEMFSEVKQEVFGGYRMENLWEDEEPVGEVVPFRRDRAKIGRNDPCPCGSGRKFKKCCMGKGIYD